MHDDLAKRLHVETHVRLEHVVERQQPGHRGVEADARRRASSRPPLGVREKIRAVRTTRRRRRQKTGGDAFGRDRATPAPPP